MDYLVLWVEGGELSCVTEMDGLGVMKRLEARWPRDGGSDGPDAVFVVDVQSQLSYRVQCGGW